MSNSIKKLLEEYKETGSHNIYLSLKDIISSCINHADYLYSSRGKIKEHEYYDEFLGFFEKKEPIIMEIYKECGGK